MGDSFMLIHRQRGAPPKRGAVIVPVLAVVMLAGALLFSLLPINSAEAGQPTSISLSPTSGAPGSTFTVNGKGFPKRQSGQILWDASATDMPTFRTSGNGTFRVSGTVPSNAGPGPHTVLSAVGTISASAVYTVELVS